MYGHDPVAGWGPDRRPFEMEPESTAGRKGLRPWGWSFKVQIASAIWLVVVLLTLPVFLWLLPELFVTHTDPKAQGMQSVFQVGAVTWVLGLVISITGLALFNHPRQAPVLVVLGFVSLIWGLVITAIMPLAFGIVVLPIIYLVGACQMLAARDATRSAASIELSQPPPTREHADAKTAALAELSESWAERTPASERGRKLSRPKASRVHRSDGCQDGCSC